MSHDDTQSDFTSPDDTQCDFDFPEADAEAFDDVTEWSPPLWAELSHYDRAMFLAPFYASLNVF